MVTAKGSRKMPLGEEAIIGLRVTAQPVGWSL
jgi:hypothetical protein